MQQQQNLTTRLVTTIYPLIQIPITTRTTSFVWTTQSSISITPDVTRQKWLRTSETSVIGHTTSSQKLPKSVSIPLSPLINKNSPKPFALTAMKSRHPHIAQIHSYTNTNRLPNTLVNFNLTTTAVFLTSKLSNKIMSTLHGFIWHFKRFHFATKEFIHQHFQFFNISCLT